MFKKYELLSAHKCPHDPKVYKCCRSYDLCYSCVRYPVGIDRVDTYNIIQNRWKEYKGG